MIVISPILILAMDCNCPLCPSFVTWAPFDREMEQMVLMFLQRLAQLETILVHFNPACSPQPTYNSQPRRSLTLSWYSQFSYSSKMWCVTEKLFRQLRLIRARCVRAICRVTRRHAWQHRISTVQLLGRLASLTIDAYIIRRQLRWLGHAAKMSAARLPRNMMSCWMRSKLPRGAPFFTYDRGLYKSLKRWR